MREKEGSYAQIWIVGIVAIVAIFVLILSLQEVSLYSSGSIEEGKNLVGEAVRQGNTTKSASPLASSSACTFGAKASCEGASNPYCEWYSNACHLPSCGGLLNKLGKADASKFDAGCFPNGVPGGQNWVFAGTTNDCGSVSGNMNKGCFYRSKSSCTPNCNGKSCGDNGCGGSCGNCPSGQFCSNGQCSAQNTNTKGLDLSFESTRGTAGCPRGQPCSPYIQRNDATTFATKVGGTDRFYIYVSYKYDSGEGSIITVLRTVPVKWYIDGVEHSTGKLWHMGEGVWITDPITITSDGHPHVLKAVIDPDNKFLETNEENNVVSGIIYLGVSCCYLESGARLCGQDTCGGGSCGSCPSGKSCVNRECQPDGCSSYNCYGKKCGESDGCGGFCQAQTCSPPQLCRAGMCRNPNDLTCTPSCSGKQCGSDGCEGSCGNCPSGQSCSNGQCISGTCTPSCNGKSCGADNGCGSKCLTGSCPAGQSCSNGQCISSSSCSDGLKNQDETDVDCGGSKCSKCSDGKSCAQYADCQSLACVNGKCVADKPAKGWLDGVSCEAGGGWVCDGDDYSKPVSVHFYMNGPAGSGTFIGSTEANTVRESAVAAQCGGNANHGFYFPTPSYLKDGLSHLIYAHAINIGVSPVNPLLSGVHSVLCSSGNETCKSPAGLVSWWTAEGSGKDVISANTGVLRNGVGFVQGKVGKAFSLDGVDDYVEVPDAANLDVTRSVTLSAWVNPSSLSCIGGWCAVLAKSGGSTRNYGLWVKGDGALVVSYKSQEYVRASSAINTIPINKWSHVVGVISPSPVGGPPVGALRLYVNGNPVAVSETLGNPNSPLIQDNNPLLIGASDLPAGYYFKGLIDEVQLYSRALAPQEVKKAYEVSSNGNCRA